MDVPAKGNVLGKVVPARYILAILGSIAMAIVYGLKVNLSVAIVGMLNHTALDLMKAADNHSSTTAVSECEGDVVQQHADGPFIWTSGVKGMILSSYFWGYFISQLPGARVAELFSAKWVMFFSVTINVVCTLLTPVMAEAHHAAVVLMRVGEGIGGGVTFPAMHVMLSKWAPPAERSVMAALVYAGTSLGTVISMLLAGVLTHNLGWESVFYVMGGLSCIWGILWVLLVQDSPQQQPLISGEERQMIVTALGGKTDEYEKKKLPVPWGAVLRSKPFWAILVAHLCSNWGWYMLLIETPLYMQQVLRFNIQQNAVNTSLPFLFLWLFSMGLSKTLDSLRCRGIINTTHARKIATLFASAVPAVCLLALCYVGCNRDAAVAIMGLGITSIGGMFCGLLSNHIDIAPNFAGTLMAITNTVATIGGIIVPVFVEKITENDPTITGWRIIFFVTIALYVVEILVYTVFASGEEQPWNSDRATEDRLVVSFESKPLNADNNKTHV